MSEQQGPGPAPYHPGPAPYHPGPGGASPAPYARPQQGVPPVHVPGQPLPPLASWIQRVGALLLDALVPLPVLLLFGIGVGVTQADSRPAVVVGVLLAVAGYLGAFAVAIWNQVFRQGRTGWTVGKQVLGIRLLAEQTMQPLGAGLTFVRAILHVLDGLPCYLGYLWPLWDPKHQTFADKIIGSVVVQQSRPPREDGHR